VSTTLQLSRVYEQNDDYSIEGAARHLGKFHVIGRSPRAAFTDPGVLRAWYAKPHLVGMRLFDVPFPAGLFGEDGEPFWREVAVLGIPISIYAPDYLAAIGKVAAQHSDIRLVIEHAALLVKAGTPRDAVFRNWGTMLRLAEVPNLFVKASALPEATDEAFPYPLAQARLGELVDAFGADRVMWGSNFTGSIRGGTYSELVDFARLATSSLPVLDQIEVLAGTARTVFQSRADVRS
jgi:L-fuconolactonase